ncbi:DUF4190 domain-containing protein [Humibacter ginsenosidimutans]|nr:DUF4190 domain-containing protein [Humibacter ginsenosidimutans]
MTDNPSPAAVNTASTPASRVISIVLLVVGVFFVFTAFDLLRGNPDLHSPGPFLLPSTGALMPIWRIAFGVSLVLGAAALTSGWILIRRLRASTWGLVAVSLLGLLGVLAPSAMIAIVFAFILGIVVPIIVAVVAEVISRSSTRSGQLAAEAASPVIGAQPATQQVEQTNGLAIAALIVVFFSSVVGLILGHVALSQIKRTGQPGHGLALAAVIIGWAVVGLVIVIALVSVVLLLSAARLT